MFFFLFEIYKVLVAPDFLFFPSGAVFGRTSELQLGCLYWPVHMLLTVYFHFLCLLSTVLYISKICRCAVTAVFAHTFAHTCIHTNIDVQDMFIYVHIIQYNSILVIRSIYLLYLFIHPSIHPSIYRLIYLYIFISIHLSIYLIYSLSYFFASLLLILISVQSCLD